MHHEEPTIDSGSNLLGLAPAAILMGMIADKIGLLGALQVIPFAPLIAAVAFAIGKRNYSRDLARLEARPAPRTAPSRTNAYTLSAESV